MSPAARDLLNFVVFQVAWFACVAGAARGHALAGTLAVVAAVALHLWLAPRRAPEAWLVGGAIAIGLVWDSLLVAAGLVSYPTGTFAPGLAPHWILAMWALFATTLNLSLGWLRGRPALAALLGAVGGPLAYFAGYRLGAIEAPEIGLALLAQGAGWAALMPLLAALAARVNGFAPAAPSLASPAVAVGARHV
jgi:hypothetical protein